MFRNKARWFSVLAALTLVAVALPISTTSNAQGNSVTFTETGKTVSGRFLQYWQTNGGLAQQGFPISEAIQQVSPTDGKTYTVQYFERAVFEAHPELAAPNDVLLSLLGVFRYQKLYGAAGAPGQMPNAEVGARLFPETGKRVGGLFLAYWQTHGGLAQQGFPISDEFNERSDLNGQTYKVQYFERAVFEFHPELAAPNNVLLSQLGTFRWKEVNTPPTPTPTLTPVPGPTDTPTPVPPTPTPDPCAGVPPATDGTVAPTCGRIGTQFAITVSGFAPNERLSFWFTAPSGRVVGTPRPLDVGPHDGTVSLRIDSDMLPLLTRDYTGIWGVTFEGEQSHHQSIVWFKILP